MAEYYPLLSRAVASLRDAPPESRRAIYDRARQALLGQLRSMQPPVPEVDINRESVALDEAIAKVEAEIAAPPVAPTETPPAPQAPSPPLITPPKPVERPVRPAPPPVADKPAVAGKVAAPAPPRPVPAASALKPPPVRPMIPASPARNPATARPTIATAPDLGSQSPSATLRATRDLEEITPALPAAPRLQVAETSREPSGSSETPVAEQAADRLASPRDEAIRPPAPRPVRHEPFSPRFLIVAVVSAVLVAGIAYTAWRLRDKPESIARSRAALIAAQHANEREPSKVIARADGADKTAPAEADSTAPAPAPAQNSTPSTEPQPAAPAADATPPAQTGTAPSATAADTASQPADSASVPSTPTPATPAPAGDQSAPSSQSASVPVSQRAALLVDAPDTPEKVKTFIGTVVWTTDSVSAGQGQPLATALHADVDIPDAKLQLKIVIQKNFEQQFPASHTVDIQFMPQAGNTLGDIKQINVPQMRNDDQQTGDPLSGVPVTIKDNYFLVGLTRGSAEGVNLDLLRRRSWFDIPMQFSSGKIAKITFEKGQTGQKMIEDAIQSWQ